MPLPPYHAFGFDILRVLAASPGGLLRADLKAQVARDRALTVEQLAEVIPSGHLTFENRLGWACSWLKELGLVSNPQRSRWEITDAGRARLATGTPFVASERHRPARRAQALADNTSLPESSSTSAPRDSTPRERIDFAIEEIRADVRSSVLERIGRASPLFFERLVLRLLTKMGYADKLGRADHHGRSGDGGIDGIVYLDRLGLERVYVQAKRWAGSVGASTVRDFAGSMDAESATKGVILATSTFTPEAKAYVQRSPKVIRLVDGDELARLMVEFEVGVSRADTILVPMVDEGAFEEE